MVDMYVGVDEFGVVPNGVPGWNVDIGLVGSVAPVDVWVIPIDESIHHGAQLTTGKSDILSAEVHSVIACVGTVIVSWEAWMRITRVTRIDTRTN